MLDLAPASHALTDLVRGVRPTQLTDPTPCAEMSVAQLLHHVDGFALVFAAAARKAPMPAAAGSPTVDANGLIPGWQERIPQRLTELAQAWAREQSWTGETSAAGVDLTGDVAGMFAVDEVIVHGWDLAAATGQPYTCSPDLLEPLHTFVGTLQQGSGAGPGLFGPPVDVPAQAPLLDRVIGLTGRDPGWRAATTGAAG